MLTISTDPRDVDLDKLHTWIQGSYWAPNRKLEVQRKACDNSLNFVALEDGVMVGFARIVTDYATFAWLCDVLVDESCRGRGIGKALVEAVVSHPELCNLRRMILGTRDAHELYRRYGFEEDRNGRIMLRRFEEG